jgi:hypothetical protein
MSTDAFLSRHLLELALLEAPARRTTVPGFDEAFRWPGTAPQLTFVDNVEAAGIGSE